MSIASAAAAPAAAIREESWWVMTAALVPVDAAADDEVEAEVEALSVAEVLPVVVEPVWVVDEASLPVLVPVSAELEPEDVDDEPASVEQVTEVGRSVTPPRAQRDLATFRVAVDILALMHWCNERRATYCPGLPWNTCRPHSKRHRSRRTWLRRCT